MIPKSIKIKGGKLPDEPGVYFYYDASDALLYIGKATSLKKRVGSYFNKAHDNRIADLVSRIARINCIVTPTVIEALVLEANQIKVHQPPYNIMQKDGKSFLYMVVTNEEFPRPLLLRGRDLEREGVDPFATTLRGLAKKKYKAVFGPFTSGPALRKALEIIRPAIPWSTCQSPEITGKTRPCFDAQIKRCPGVCSGRVDKAVYRQTIRDLIAFFSGEKKRLVKRIERAMHTAADELRFEDAERLKRQLFSLQHIQDVALIMKEDVELPYEKLHESFIDVNGRVEAYDISNISGTSAVGSMVVFEHGRPSKQQYRKFKIKTVKGANDVAMMDEVMRRRLRRAALYPKAWPLPELMVIDGGVPQVNAVQAALTEFGFDVPIVGLAKGPDRKQDELIYDISNADLSRVVIGSKKLLQQARDEAHRFAGAYHRKLRSKASGIVRKRRLAKK